MKLTIEMCNRLFYSKSTKGYILITLLCFSISLSFVLLTASFVFSQKTLDGFHQNRERIFVIANEQNINSGYYFNRYIKNRYPEVELSAAYQYDGTHLYDSNGNTYSANTALADSSFFDIFSFEIISGQLSSWKASSNSALISKSFSNSLFGSRDPIGNHLLLDGGIEVIVCGIFDDFHNTIFNRPDIILRGEICQRLNPSNNEKMSNATSSVSFFLLYPNTNLTSKHDDILQYLKDICWAYNSTFQDVKIIPFKDLYYLENGSYDWTNSIVFGNRSLVSILFALCIVLFLFSVLNYVNMTIALFGMRSKEYAIKQLLGKTKKELLIASITESIVICAIALVLALVIAGAMTPVASRVLACPFSIKDCISPLSSILMTSFIVGVGFITGAIPPVLSYRMSPLDVVRGRFKVKMKTFYSKAIAITQMTITTLLVFIIIIMRDQINAMISAPLNYNTEDILNIDNQYGTSTQLTYIINRLEQEPCVEKVGYGLGTPLSGTNNVTLQLESGKWISFQQIIGNNDYFSILGLNEKSDNSFPGAFWLNEYAFKELGLEESATSFYTKDNVVDIGGVYYDFKIKPLLEKQSPALIYNFKDNSEIYPWNIVVKVLGDHPKAYNIIEQIFKREYPNVQFSATYIEDEITNSFSKEKRLLIVLSLFTFITILMSALGLFSISGLNLRQQYREIAIKKTFGESKKSLLVDIFLSFLSISIISSLIATPVGYVIMKQWLSVFPYNVDITIWSIVISLSFSVIITLVSIVYQAIKAIHINPVDLLANE